MLGPILVRRNKAIAPYKPARSIELNIMDKDEPALELVNN
jgi:hypothetical protein